MKQYIQYHMAWERGNPLAFSRPKAFTEDKPNKEGLALASVENNSRVWLIYRESEDSKDYFVAYTFIATDFDLDDGKIVVFGDAGAAEVFMPPFPLNAKKYPWFAELMKRHGNFAFGFMALNEDGVKNLEAIRASASVVLR